jgi:class 3 adenylate cyclase
MKARFSSDDAIISMDKTPPPGSNTPGSSPIAELYPETTVLFADIVGFTSWSSARQPTQVFHLLESVFATFDKIAKQRGVFKVETIGDCYVAVVGLPTPRKHHAVVMSRFANDCRAAMYELTRELDTVLGPVRQ